MGLCSGRDVLVLDDDFILVGKVILINITLSRNFPDSRRVVLFSREQNNSDHFLIRPPLTPLTMTTESGEATMVEVELGSTDAVEELGSTDAVVEGPRERARAARDTTIERRKYKWCPRIVRGLLLCALYLLVYGLHLLFTTMIFVNRGHEAGSWYSGIMSILVSGFVLLPLITLNDEGLGDFTAQYRPSYDRKNTTFSEYVLLLFGLCGLALLVLTPLAAIRYNDYSVAPEYQGFQDNVTMNQVPVLARSGLVLEVKDALVQVDDFTSVPFSKSDQLLLIPVTSDSSNITVNAWIISTGPSVLEAYVLIDPAVQTFTLHSRSRAEVFAFNMAYPKWKSSHPQWIISSDAVFIDQVTNLNLNAKKSAKDILTVYYIAWGCVFIVLLLTLMMMSFLLPK
jgi:hypothetical protein